MSRLAQRQGVKKTKGVWIAVGVVLAVFFLLIVGGLTRVAFNGGFSMNNDDQKAMQSYLVKKYGGEFTVSKPIREGSGLGVNGYIIATATPKEGDIEFKVGRSATGFYDFYHNALWSSQEQPNVTAIINTFKGTHPSSTVSISPSKTFKNELGGSLPSYLIAHQNSPDQLTYLVDLEMEIAEQSYASAVQQLANDLKPLATYVDNQEVGMSYIGITINTPSVRYTCELSSNGSDLTASLDNNNFSSCFKESKGE